MNSPPKFKIKATGLFVSILPHFTDGITIHPISKATNLIKNFFLFKTWDHTQVSLEATHSSLPPGLFQCDCLLHQDIRRLNFTL
jgi:hypothetical protein